ncbi:MAG: hypothetical protein EKK40_14375 [Bradyrhizobiaceae bacterium]|nr:MAG: hypothetical protein EKK40_14375 [Bradyrhizobiaceae bacterium]
MFPARQIAVAVAAFLLIPGACLAPLFPASAQAQGASACEDSAGVAVLPVPVSPWKGAPLRVLFTAEKPIEGQLSLVAPDGSIAVTSQERHGGPPYFWFAEVAKPAAGTWRVQLTRDHASAGCATITRDIAVRNDEPPRPGTAAGSLWPLRNSWDRATENLYSAWIEKLFDSPLDSPLSWAALHEVIRDRSRNIMFNYLGLGEDETKLVLKPDCADMPYFLRAYFAFKMGLPFGYSKCSRGSASGAPKCPQWFNVQNQDPSRSVSGPKTASADGSVPDDATAPAPKRLGLVASFNSYIPIIGDAVHSGSGRTAATDDNTDYYPVALTQEALRPGTIYADPFGHVLMLTRRVPQTADAAGVFLAADAQPDGTVAIKRFWRGNFLFDQNPALGGPGFKHFRPIVRESNGALRRLTNAEISRNPQYADYSPEQSKLSVEAFYDRMDDVMSPSPLDPAMAMKEAITSLDEQVQARVTSVENGRKFLNSGRGEAAMPDGPSIFETTGAWEDFATPSRDLRLLIAIDVVRNFPERVARRPDRYAMPRGQSVAQVQADLQNMLASELSTRKISYPRTDGSTWTLTLADVVNRASALEMAYNVNDCAELRWGAAAGSAEAATCKRTAPEAQRAKMSKYRVWFHERRRPPRGGAA